jgi:hypothetical protein
VRACAVHLMLAWNRYTLHSKESELRRRRHTASCPAADAGCIRSHQDVHASKAIICVQPTIEANKTEMLGSLFISIFFVLARVQLLSCQMGDIYLPCSPILHPTPGLQGDQWPVSHKGNGLYRKGQSIIKTRLDRPDITRKQPQETPLLFQIVPSSEGNTTMLPC